MELLPVLIAGLFLLAGVALGWWLGARPAGAARAEADARFRQAVTDLEREVTARHAAERACAGHEAQAAERQRGWDAETAERQRGWEAQAAARQRGWDEAAAERERAWEARLAELREAKEALAAQFSDVGGRILGDAQKAFLERADQRFAQAGEQGEARLKALLAPVQDTLKRYEEGLGRVEKERVDSYAELRQTVTALAQGNDTVRRETARLANVLRSSPKHRGRWGEEQLRTVLESAGLQEHVDFSLQATVNDGERQLRPDCVINLPGGRCIVVDVKCPLVAFEQAFDEEDEERRHALLLAHANAVRAYAGQLGAKGYWRQFDRSPDFVILFVPGEHFLSAAAERAPDLIESAFRQGVIVASTINMLALAKVMAGMWRQEALADQAKEIAQLGKELYGRLATMGDHVSRLGRSLAQASGAYNSFVGSLESQVLTQAKRFEALKVESGGKAVETPPLVEVSVRPLAKLSAGGDAATGAAE